MLEALKEQLKVDNTSNLVMEATNDADVRDLFLDDTEAIVLGAENDPEINAIIAKIPEYDDYDKSVAREIEALTESAVLELK